MNLVRFVPLLVSGAALSVAPDAAWSQDCATIGGGNHVVCANLGNPCSPPSDGNCQTIIIPKEDTQGGDCVCAAGKAAVPNDSTFFLDPTGPLPAAEGSATVRWLPDGRRAAAIGLRGLDPFASYRVLAHVGSVSDCSGGTPTPIGGVVQADALGDAVLIEDIPTICPISVEEVDGLQRTVLCGVAPVTSLPASGREAQVVLALSLGLVALLVLRQRFGNAPAGTSPGPGAHA